MKKQELKNIIKESLRPNLNESQKTHDYFRGFGLNPDNIPHRTQSILAKLKPGQYFTDYSGKICDGPYMLSYKSTERSLYNFNKINLETGKIDGEVTIQRGNLAKLRPTLLGSWKLKDKLNESKSCSCGCNKCGNASLLNEALKHTYPISEQFRSLINAKKPLINELKSTNNVKLIREARILFDKGILNLKGKDKELFENTDFGRYKIKGGGLILEGVEDSNQNTLLNSIIKIFKHATKYKSNSYPNERYAFQIDTPSASTIYLRTKYFGDWKDNIQVRLNFNAPGDEFYVSQGDSSFKSNDLNKLRNMLVLLHNKKVEQYKSNPTDEYTTDLDINNSINESKISDIKKN